MYPEWKRARAPWWGEGGFKISPAFRKWRQPVGSLAKKKPKKTHAALLAPPLDHINLTQQFEPKRRLSVQSAPEKTTTSRWERRSVWKSFCRVGYSWSVTQHCCLNTHVPLCSGIVARRFQLLASGYWYCYWFPIVLTVLLCDLHLSILPGARFKVCLLWHLYSPLIPPPSLCNAIPFSCGNAIFTSVPQLVSACVQCFSSASWLSRWAALRNIIYLSLSPLSPILCSLERPCTYPGFMSSSMDDGRISVQICIQKSLNKKCDQIDHILPSR